MSPTFDDSSPVRVLQRCKCPVVVQPDFNDTHRYKIGCHIVKEPAQTLLRPSRFIKAMIPKDTKPSSAICGARRTVPAICRSLAPLHDVASPGEILQALTPCKDTLRKLFMKTWIQRPRSDDHQLKLGMLPSWKELRLLISSASALEGSLAPTMTQTRSSQIPVQRSICSKDSKISMALFSWT